MQLDHAVKWGVIRATLLCGAFFCAYLFAGSQAVASDTTSALAQEQQASRIALLPTQGEAYTRVIEDVWLLAADELPLAIEVHVGPQQRLDTLVDDADWLVGVTAEQAERAGMYLGPALLQQQFLLFQRRHLPAIEAIEQAEGYVIGVVQGHATEHWLTTHYPQLKLARYPTLEDMLTSASQGRLHVFAHSNLLSIYDERIAPGAQELQYAFPPSRQQLLFSQSLYIATRDTADHAMIEDALEQTYTAQRRFLQTQRSLDLTSLVSLQQDELQWLMARDEIAVGVPIDSRPILFFDRDGIAQGLDVDFLSLIGNRSGIAFEYHACGDWEACLQALENREIDVLSFSTETPERRQYAVFTSPYWEAPWATATQQQELTGRYRYSELSGTTLAVTRGYSLLEDLQQIAELDLLVVDSPNEGLSAVLAGRADSYLDSLPLLVERVREQPTGNLYLNIMRNETGDVVRLAVRSDWPVLRDILDRAVQSISEDDQARIAERWFDVQFERGLSRADIIPYVLYSGAAVAVLIGFFWWWNSRLRREVRRRYRAEKKMRYLARHDDLTGLPNRHLLADRLKQIVATHQRYKRQFALLFLDLDGFKDVNDELGHAAGDQLLQQVAKRLTNSVRAQDTVCRFGGDEFVIVLTEQHSSQLAEQVAHKLIEQITQPYQLRQGQEQMREAIVSVSIGMAMYPLHSRSTDELMRLADKAMYEVKNEGKNGVCMAPLAADGDDI